MSTTIRPAISKKNKYWIGRHRYYELKHFCLQYSSWKKARAALNELTASTLKMEGRIPTSVLLDPTSSYVLAKASYEEKIHSVESAAYESDEFLGSYILKAVTENLSYDYLKTKMDMPCCRDTYYDRYRRFFWLLNKKRD